MSQSRTQVDMATRMHCMQLFALPAAFTAAPLLSTIGM